MGNTRGSRITPSPADSRIRILLAAFLCAAQFSFAQNGSSPATAQASTEPVVAGKIELIEGDVRFLDAKSQLRRPKVGDVAHEGDSIVTGDDGEVHLNMEDGGYIGVRPNTKMRIVNFRAEGGNDDRAVFSLIQGSFRSITGWIAKLNTRNYTVRTPTATIGVRGTEHEPLVIPEGSKLGDAGTYDRVHAGETVIETPQGSVNVRPNQAGFVPHGGTLRPRVLDRVPGFFRPTRNEKRFEGLHGRIQQQLQQRREQRRQFIQEHRKQLGAPQKAAARERQEQRRERAGKSPQEHEKARQERQARERAAKSQKEREKARKEFLERQHERGKAGEHVRARKSEEADERPHLRRQD